MLQNNKSNINSRFSTFIKIIRLISTWLQHLKLYRLNMGKLSGTVVIIIIKTYIFCKGEHSPLNQEKGLSLIR